MRWTGNHAAIAVAAVTLLATSLGASPASAQALGTPRFSFSVLRWAGPPAGSFDVTPQVESRRENQRWHRTHRLHTRKSKKKGNNAPTTPGDPALPGDGSTGGAGGLTPGPITPVFVPPVTPEAPPVPPTNPVTLPGNGAAGNVGAADLAPEPASAALFLPGLGALGALTLLRKKRSR
ncbi:MAG TPA: hypothetical protein VFU47_13710 [Armatimonadota bacterium]|nr:hypothetical protein [Armatimonadota bacterium]